MAGRALRESQQQQRPASQRKANRSIGQRVTGNLCVRLWQAFDFSLPRPLQSPSVSLRPRLKPGLGLRDLTFAAVDPLQLVAVCKHPGGPAAGWIAYPNCNACVAAGLSNSCLEMADLGVYLYLNA